MAASYSFGGVTGRVLQLIPAVNGWRQSRRLNANRDVDHMTRLSSQEAATIATSWVTCSSCSAWSAGWCTAAFAVSRDLHPSSLHSFCRYSFDFLFSPPPAQTGGSTVPPVMPRVGSGSTWPRSPPALRGCCGCSSTASFISCGWQCSSCVSSTRFGFQTTPATGQCLFRFLKSWPTLLLPPLRSQLWESPRMKGWMPGDTSTLKSQPRQSKAPSSKCFSCLRHLNLFNYFFFLQLVKIVFQGSGSHRHDLVLCVCSPRLTSVLFLFSSHGCFRNLADFFEIRCCGLFRPVAVDWTTQYTIEYDQTSGSGYQLV